MPTPSPGSHPAPPLTGPLSLAELLDRAFRLYRLRFREFVQIAGWLLIPYALLSAIVTGSAMSGYVSLLWGVAVTPNLEDPEQATRLLSNLGGYFVVTLLVTLLGLAVFLLTTTALTNHAIAALHGRTGTGRASVQAALRRFWPALRMNALRLGGLALLGLALASGVGIMVGLSTFALGAGLAVFSPEGDPGMAAIGFFALLLIGGYLLMALVVAAPPLYLAARWQVALPAIVDQGWSARKALGESWSLTRGQVRRAAIYLILIWLLSFALNSVPVYLVELVAYTALGVNGSFMFFTGISSFVAALLSILWQPLAAIAVTMFYFDLRVRQHGLDIETRLAQLERELGVEPARAFPHSSEVSVEASL